LIKIRAECAALLARCRSAGRGEKTAICHLERGDWRFFFHFGRTKPVSSRPMFRFW